MLNNSTWIKAPFQTEEEAITFRREFTLGGKVKSATLAVTSVGVYEAKINGKRVTDAVLTPGFTAYKKRIPYQEYDVTALLSEQNEITIGVGNGWAVGHFGIATLKNVYFKQTAVNACLLAELENGEKICVKTDTDWGVYTSLVTFSDLYNGETRDLLLTPEYRGNAVFDTINSALVPQDGEWIKEQDRLGAIELITTPNGERVVDFGQNMTGYVEVHAKGKRGDRIVLHHAEVLDSDGNFYLANYRGAKNEVTYILSGDEVTLKPIYSFQGFRYVRLTEAPDDLTLDDITAVVVHSEIERTGDFSCGNEKINQLYHNVIWGQKSNFLDIPTDCPQRDERLGWTGDAQVFCRTACINYDVERFFAKWLTDMASEQTASGAIPRIVPNCFREEPSCSAGWGDAATVVPYELYRAYGDKELLQKHLPLMKNWVKHVHGYGDSEFLWLGDNHFGDWLGMDAGEDSYVGATDKNLIASAYFARSTHIVAEALEILGEDSSEYRELHKNVVAAFRDYFMENGMPKAKFEYGDPAIVACRGITQTAISLILNYGIATEEERPALAKRLAELIEENDGKMATGFIGTPEILHALSNNGYTDLAYSLLLSEKNPSWLYSVNRGATTMWEHWNGIKEDGSFWSEKMNSFNHYAYGAVYSWIFDTVMGVTPTEAAYKTFSITPHPSRLLGFAKASLNTRYGRIASAWYYRDGYIHFEFEVPDGTEATITLPSGRTATVGAGSYTCAEKAQN